MPPRKVSGKTRPEDPPKKRQKVGPTEPSKESQALVAAEPQSKDALVSRGGGRGLKAVQNAREQSSTSSGPDGTQTESKKSVKEQRLFRAHNNAHVETKVMSEQKRKTTKKDGTVVVTESKSVRKVCYL